MFLLSPTPADGSKLCEDYDFILLCVSVVTPGSELLCGKSRSKKGDLQLDLKVVGSVVFKFAMGVNSKTLGLLPRKPIYCIHRLHPCGAQFYCS